MLCARAGTVPGVRQYQSCPFALATLHPVIIPDTSDALATEMPGPFYSGLDDCRGIPVIIDAEKDRPHLKDLLPLADYIICNRHFPEAFTGRY